MPVSLFFARSVLTTSQIQVQFRHSQTITRNRAQKTSPTAQAYTIFPRASIFNSLSPAAPVQHFFQRDSLQITRKCATRKSYTIAANADQLFGEYPSAQIIHRSSGAWTGLPECLSTTQNTHGISPTSARNATHVIPIIVVRLMV